MPTGSVLKTGGQELVDGQRLDRSTADRKWPDDLKQIMNIKAEKKADPDLTEVIYPCLDGKIYFLDLKDGTYTRSPIRAAAGPSRAPASLYPDGTPILFVGHGDNSPGKETVRARLYSLIDQKLLYTFGPADPDSLPQVPRLRLERALRRQDRHDHRARGKRPALHHQAEHPVRQGGRHPLREPGPAGQGALHRPQV